MSNESLHVRAERFDALTRLISEDGSTSPGVIPTDHVAALQQTERLGEADQIADAHADGRGPPDHVGGGRGPPDGQGQGGPS